jgi:hypothetical protein
MVEAVRIFNKEIIAEKHKRQPIPTRSDENRLIDLSHIIEDGLVTYKGLPAPIICDYLSREKSREIYAPGTEFQIAKIEMVANTGTYLDCPFHRYPTGKDLSEVDLDRFTDLEGMVVRADHRQTLAVGVEFFQGKVSATGQCWCTPAGTSIGIPSTTTQDIRFLPKRRQYI